MYNKKSFRWTVVQMKEKKQYGHIPALLSKTMTYRLEVKGGMQGPCVLEVDDPRRISKNIAPILPPPTTELVLQLKSRMKRREVHLSEIDLFDRIMKE